MYFCGSVEGANNVRGLAYGFNLVASEYPKVQSDYDPLNTCGDQEQ